MGQTRTFSARSPPWLVPSALASTVVMVAGRDPFGPAQVAVVARAGVVQAHEPAVQEAPLVDASSTRRRRGPIARERARPALSGIIRPPLEQASGFRALTQVYRSRISKRDPPLRIPLLLRPRAQFGADVDPELLNGESHPLEMVRLSDPLLAAARLTGLGVARRTPHALHLFAGQLAGPGVQPPRQSSALA
jgi:hypothetical protein